MLFSSTVFLYLFLPVLLFFYYIVFRKSRICQNVLLLLASLFFYAWGEPKFVIIMIASIIVNWAFGLLVHKHREKRSVSRLIIALSVMFNLSILFVFKYLTFAGGIVESLVGANWSIPTIALPIGISFFTFQGLSYVIDVYRQKGEVQNNLLYVGLYISFFPQLIAGPIVRYETVADEIKNRRENPTDFFDGFARFVLGMAKKVLLANAFALLADQVFNAAKAGDNISVAFSWLGALAYMFQIFFDFSGYSDMAIGLGRMFGFHFLENFDYPYISTSISEFWRRWHMSLGTWFRDYLYFPLGGSRVKRGRMIFNLFVVWSLTGLWHGANLTFVVWGLMYFLLITIEKLTGFEKTKATWSIPLKHIYTLFFVIMGWVVFRAESMPDALHYFGAMFGLNGNALVDGLATGYFFQNLVLIIVAMVASTPLFRTLDRRFCDRIAYRCIYAAVLILLFILSLASLVSNSYNPFIYFNF